MRLQRGATSSWVRGLEAIDNTLLETLNSEEVSGFSLGMLVEDDTLGLYAFKWRLQQIWMVPVLEEATAKKNSHKNHRSIVVLE